VTDATYRNFGHYIGEGWSAEPKQTFLALAQQLTAECGEPSGELLDIGCATGELIGFLQSRFRGLKATGVDIFDELLAQARKHVPDANFIKASALDLPNDFANRFAVVTAIGVASVFDEKDIQVFWRNALKAAKRGGVVAVLSPLNEFGVDTVTRHRKRRDGTPLAWETGWNVYAIETINEIVTALGATIRVERFRFRGHLEPKPDPVRTWTMSTEKDPEQLTNGMKLLIDHYFMIARKKD